MRTAYRPVIWRGRRAGLPMMDVPRVALSNVGNSIKYDASLMVGSKASSFINTWVWIAALATAAATTAAAAAAAAAGAVAAVARCLPRPGHDRAHGLQRYGSYDSYGQAARAVCTCRMAAVTMGGVRSTSSTLAVPWGRHFDDRGQRSTGWVSAAPYQLLQYPGEGSLDATRRHEQLADGASLYALPTMVGRDESGRA